MDTHINAMEKDRAKMRLQEKSIKRHYDNYTRDWMHHCVP